MKIKDPAHAAAFLNRKCTECGEPTYEPKWFAFSWVVESGKSLSMDIPRLCRTHTEGMIQRGGATRIARDNIRYHLGWKDPLEVPE